MLLFKHYKMKNVHSADSTKAISSLAHSLSPCQPV